MKKIGFIFAAAGFGVLMLISGVIAFIVPTEYFTAALVIAGAFGFIAAVCIYYFVVRRDL